MNYPANAVASLLGGNAGAVPNPAMKSAVAFVIYRGWG